MKVKLVVRLWLYFHHWPVKISLCSTWDGKVALFSRFPQIIFSYSTFLEEAQNS